jgi:hypothetical protein
MRRRIRRVVLGLGGAAAIAAVGGIGVEGPREDGRAAPRPPVATVASAETGPRERAVAIDAAPARGAARRRGLAADIERQRVTMARTVRYLVAMRALHGTLP